VAAGNTPAPPGIIRNYTRQSSPCRPHKAWPCVVANLRLHAAGH